jgi:hypothetical protein
MAAAVDDRRSLEETINAKIFVGSADNGDGYSLERVRGIKEIRSK